MFMMIYNNASRLQRLWVAVARLLFTVLCLCLSRLIKGGCSGNRVWWFTSYYRLFYYAILPPSTAPPSHCTPL